MQFNIIHLEDEISKNRVLPGALYYDFRDIITRHLDLGFVNVDDRIDKSDHSLTIEFTFDEQAHSFFYKACGTKKEFLKEVKRSDRGQYLAFVLMDWQYKTGDKIELAGDVFAEIKDILDTTFWAFWTAWPGEVETYFPDLPNQGQKLFSKGTPVDKLSKHIIRSFLNSLEGQRKTNEE